MRFCADCCLFISSRTYAGVTYVNSTAVPYIPWEHTGDIYVYLHSSSPSATDGGEWSRSRFMPKLRHAAKQFSNLKNNFHLINIKKFSFLLHRKTISVVWITRNMNTPRRKKSLQHMNRLSEGSRFWYYTPWFYNLIPCENPFWFLNMLCLEIFTNKNLHFRMQKYITSVSVSSNSIGFTTRHS